ncbi:DgyrCDS314 [Dimorphilus gyrociliatus]|uniref:Golgi apparatus membrane protein TVP23 homolog n=1 Tax=Dimorphilus gyrociliatus TaxID=2664684 RepID=A0A7I8V5F8_9ANNE|nr:DgyrCDS314 [Dimorphilus gyrociliatus]
MNSQTIGLTDGTEDVALNFGEEDEIAEAKKRKIQHPLALVFHLTFRVLALLTYLFCGLFSNSFIVSFVSIVVLLSMDFWTVKNITGRLLVGLRWWNHVDDDGKSHWIFESRKGSSAKKLSAIESQIFWLGIVGCEIIWVLLFIGTLFTLKFKWLMVVCVGIGLNGANLYGYVRCKIGSKKPLSSVASSFLGQQVFRSSQETDEFFDGKKDETRLLLEIPLLGDENVKGIDMLVFFEYKLYTYQRLTMECMAHVSRFSPFTGSELTTVGDLKFKQRFPIGYKGTNNVYNKSIINSTSLLSESYDLSTIFANYAKRNFSTTFSDEYAVWKKGKPINDRFVVDATIKYPEETIL